SSTVTVRSPCLTGTAPDQAAASGTLRCRPTPGYRSIRRPTPTIWSFRCRCARRVSRGSALRTEASSPPKCSRRPSRSCASSLSSVRPRPTPASPDWRSSQPGICHLEPPRARRSSAIRPASYLTRSTSWIHPASALPGGPVDGRRDGTVGMRAERHHLRALLVAQIHRQAGVDERCIGEVFDPERLRGRVACRAGRVADRWDAELVEGVRVPPHARDGVADDRGRCRKRLRVAALDRVDEALRAPGLESRAIEEELHGPFDPGLLEDAAQLVTDVHR